MSMLITITDVDPRSIFYSYVDDLRGRPALLLNLRPTLLRGKWRAGTLYVLGDGKLARTELHIVGFTFSPLTSVR